MYLFLSCTQSCIGGAHSQLRAAISTLRAVVASPATFPWRCDGQASRHSAGRWEVLDDDRATGVTSTATAVSQRVAPRPRGEHMPTLGKIQGIAAFETQAVPCQVRRWCC